MDDIRLAELCKTIVDANLTKKGQQNPLEKLQQAVEEQLEQQSSNPAQPAQPGQQDGSTAPAGSTNNGNNGAENKPQPPPAAAPKPPAKPTSKNQIATPSPVKTNTSDDNKDPQQQAKEQQQPNVAPNDPNYIGTNQPQKPNEPNQPFRPASASLSSLIKAGVLESTSLRKQAAGYFMNPLRKDRLLKKLIGHFAAIRLGDELVPVGVIENESQFADLVQSGATGFYRMVKEASDDFKIRVNYGDNEASKDAAIKQVDSVVEMLSSNDVDCNVQENLENNEILIDCHCDDVSTSKLLTMIADILMDQQVMAESVFDLSELGEGNLQELESFVCPMEKC